MDQDFISNLMARGLISPDVAERMFPEGSEPQRQSRADIMSQGLRSAAEYITPDYLKDTPMTPVARDRMEDMIAGRVPPGKIGAPSGPPTAMQKIGGLAGDVALNAVPASKMLGAAGAAVRPILRGNEFARRALETHILPHIEEPEFVEKYFGGMHNSSIRLDGGSKSKNGPYVNFNGMLSLPGGDEGEGEIRREIYPKAGTAYHAYLRLPDDMQGAGIVKNLMRNQFDVYDKIGVGRVALNANIDVGGYAWARYGALPASDEEWNRLARNIGFTLAKVRGVSPNLRQKIENMLSSSDPRMTWLIADLTDPDPHGVNKTIGQTLLKPQNWMGKWDFDNEVQMDRFNKYVGR